MDIICIYFLLNNADITSQDLGLSWHPGVAEHVAITFLQEKKVINTGCHSSISAFIPANSNPELPVFSLGFLSSCPKPPRENSSSVLSCQKDRGVTWEPVEIPWWKTNGRGASFLSVSLLVHRRAAPKSSLASTEKCLWGLLAVPALPVLCTQGGCSVCGSQDSPNTWEIPHLLWKGDEDPARLFQKLLSQKESWSHQYSCNRLCNVPRSDWQWLELCF